MTWGREGRQEDGLDVLWEALGGHQALHGGVHLGVLALHPGRLGLPGEGGLLDP